MAVMDTAQDDDVGSPSNMISDEDLAQLFLGKVPDMAGPGGAVAPAGSAADPRLRASPVAGTPAMTGSIPAAPSVDRPISGPPNPSTGLYPGDRLPSSYPKIPMAPAAAVPPAPQPGETLPLPPNFDMAERQRQQAALANASKPAQAKDTWGNYFRSIIAAGLAAYGRDPGAIGRGLEVGRQIRQQPQDQADKERQDKIDAAKQDIQNSDFNYNRQRQTYEDQLKGYQARTARKSEENREADEDRKAQEMNTEIDRNFNGGKPTKITGPDGKEEWVVRTKNGAYVPTSAPEEKPYKSAYERSQSKDPAEAAQGRKDYENEERRRDQRIANDTTRANAAKENADKKGAGKGPGKDTTTRHYNDKVDKARKTLNDSVGVLKGIPNWQSKPALKAQVQQAYDDYNDAVQSYHKEASDEGGENFKVPKPGREPYPWEKGNQQPSQNRPQNSTQAPQKGKPVNSYTSPKSGKVYKSGDKLPDGRKIKQVYDNGTMDVE